MEDSRCEAARSCYKTTMAAVRDSQVRSDHARRPRGGHGGPDRCQMLRPTRTRPLTVTAGDSAGVRTERSGSQSRAQWELPGRAPTVGLVSVGGWCGRGGEGTRKAVTRVSTAEHSTAQRGCVGRIFWPCTSVPA